MTKEEYLNDKCKCCNLCDGSAYHRYHCPEYDQADSAWDNGYEQGKKEMLEKVKAYLIGHTFRNVKGEYIHGGFIAEQLDSFNC